MRAQGSANTSSPTDIGAGAGIERVKQGGCEIVAVDDEEIDTVKTRLQGLNVRLALDVIGGSSAGRYSTSSAPKAS